MRRFTALLTTLVIATACAEPPLANDPATESSVAAAARVSGPPPHAGPPDGREPACDRFEIDGDITVRERFSARRFPMAIAREGGEPIDLTFFVCNSDTDLYAAVEVDHDLGVLPSEFFLFGLQLTTCDPSPTSCPFQLDDNSAVRWVNGLIEQFDEWRRSEPTAFESFLDVSHGGNDEIVRALSTGDGFTRVEMSKPLTTGDQFDHDLASLGQVIASMTLQFNFQGDPSHYFAGTGAFIYDVR